MALSQALWRRTLWNPVPELVYPSSTSRRSNSRLSTSQKAWASTSLPKPWISFETEVVSTLDSLSDDPAFDNVFATAQAQQFFPARDEAERCGDETTVQSLFDHHIGRPLYLLADRFDAHYPDTGKRPDFGAWRLLESQLRKVLVLDSAEGPKAKIPDRCIVRNAGTELVEVVEVKCPWGFPLNKLVDYIYGEEGMVEDDLRDVRFILGEVLAQMVAGKVRIGCLTTYETSVFIRLVAVGEPNPEAQVQCSRAVRNTTRRGTDGEINDPELLEGGSIDPRFAQCTSLEAHFFVGYHWLNNRPDLFTWGNLPQDGIIQQGVWLREYDLESSGNEQDGSESDEGSDEWPPSGKRRPRNPNSGAAGSRGGSQSQSTTLRRSARISKQSNSERARDAETEMVSTDVNVVAALSSMTSGKNEIRSALFSPGSLQEEEEQPEQSEDRKVKVLRMAFEEQDIWF